MFYNVVQRWGFGMAKERGGRMTTLVIDCQNCEHCKFNRAYESCDLRIKNKIIYNHKKEAENCGHYKQKKEVEDE